MKFVTGLLSVVITLMASSSWAADDSCSSGPNTTDPNDCCATPMIIPMDVITECLTTYSDMQKKKNELPGIKRGCCIGDCITEKMGVNPKGDGNLNRSELKVKLQEQLKGDETWMLTLNNAFDNCFAIADSKVAEYQAAFELKPAFEGEKICHPISGQTLGCISNEMFINCPTSVWKANGECNDIKEYVKRCETIPRHA